MKVLKKTIGVFALVCLFTGVAQADLVKSMAPDFTLKSMRGDNLKLSEHRGEVVMVNFWASWCAPCRQEFPLLNDMYLKYRDMGFTLLGVNVEEDPGKAKAWLRDMKVAFPILLDSTNKVSKQYDVKAMPSTYIIDRDGKVRYMHRGYLPGYEDEYQKQIRELIRE